MGTNPFLRAVLFPLLPALLAAALGFGVVNWLASSPTVLDQQVIDEATSASMTDEELLNAGTTESDRGTTQALLQQHL